MSPLYMSGHAVCVSVSILVCAYGKLHTDVKLMMTQFGDRPEQPDILASSFHDLLLITKISRYPFKLPPHTQQQSQPGISSIFSGESRTKPSFVTGILVFLLPGQLCQEMLCPKFPLTRKQLVDPWLKKFQELYCKRCS